MSADDCSLASDTTGGGRWRGKRLFRLCRAERRRAERSQVHFQPRGCESSFVVRQATVRVADLERRHDLTDRFGAAGVRIRRYTADHVALTGATPVPVVLQSNRVDPIVTPRMSSGYAALATQAGRGVQVRLLPGVGGGHCRFPLETVWNALAALRAN